MTVAAATPRAKNAASRAVATAWQCAVAAAGASWLHDRWLSDLFGWSELQIEMALLTVIASGLAWLKNWIRDNSRHVPDEIERLVEQL